MPVTHGGVCSGDLLNGGYQVVIRSGLAKRGYLFLPFYFIRFFCRLS